MADERKVSMTPNYESGSRRRTTTRRTPSRDGRNGASRARRGTVGGGRRGWLGSLGIVAALGAVVVAITGVVVYLSVSAGLPDPDIRQAKGRDQSTVITDRDGKVIARLFAEQNRQDVALADMPAYLKQAVIATEDRRFYEHEGVDPLGIVRAVFVDVIKREKAQGGSTITQQYVKQAFVTSEKTLKRKVQEAILAQRVEKRYTKNQILELYLNTIYFGHGAYGVEAASRAYFGTGVEKLTLPQAAMIAGVIKSPGHYSPYEDPAAAKARRAVVLSQMLAQGYISQAQYADAIATPIEVHGLQPSAQSAPYFLEWIKAQLNAQYGRDAVYRGGLHVKTTLDPKAQHAAEEAVADILDHKGDPSAALVAIRPSTGEVVAMVGGSDFAKQQFNVAAQGKRQPGSAFKPFVLLTALQNGVSPEQSFPAKPRSFRVNGETWKVTGSTYDALRLRVATEKSVNSVFAQLILDVGADKVVGTAEDLGLEPGIDPVPAIALGGLRVGVSPLEMARAYGTLANGGVRTKPYGIAEVIDPKGTTLLEAKPESKKVADPAATWLTTDILRGVIARGTGMAAQIGRPAAGKTGTTQEYRDAWFVGYTPDLVCAVWVGYPDSQREMKSVHGIPVTGGSFPARIWARFMRAALADTPHHNFARPAGLRRVTVCDVSGGTPTEFCPKTFSAWMLATMHPEPCQIHTAPAEVALPEVTGMTKLEAMDTLQGLNLVVKVAETAGGGAPGSVVGQSPASGTKVKTGSTVTLTVVAGTGSGNPPVPRFTGPSSVRVGTAAAFDGSASTDDGSIVTYLWEFGDGQRSTKKKPSHTWTAAGTYDVTLWVTDDSGMEASITKTVVVK